MIKEIARHPVLSLLQKLKDLSERRQRVKWL
ncbi:hypothetical protein BDFB_012777 [Asbolus verrucosus]|uniref:Uncharacterized protein n=1 Tax=Asbolus verrucosus TaxID=1661398 RepID=A0A482VLF6_ASBVE|nr:hypothetical protein BDFB_012777 [Asbolus verrucosus]